MTGETSNMCDSIVHVINKFVSIMVEPEHFYKCPCFQNELRYQTCKLKIFSETVFSLSDISPKNENSAIILHTKELTS